VHLFTVEHLASTQRAAATVPSTSAPAARL